MLATLYFFYTNFNDGDYDREQGYLAQTDNMALIFGINSPFLHERPFLWMGRLHLSATAFIFGKRSLQLKQLWSWKVNFNIRIKIIL